MKRVLLILVIILSGSVIAYPQSRKELESIRKKNLEEIEYVDKLLKSTENKKKENINELRVIGKKLSIREKIINDYGEEISLLEYRISLDELACSLMERDLKRLQEEYAGAIVNAYKISKGTPAIAYILTSSDFNQGYKRLRYMQQISRYRRDEAELIKQIYGEIEKRKVRLASDVKSINELKIKEERQKYALTAEQRKKESLVNSLGKKETQLRKELEEKKRIAKKIENEIARLIEEESAKSKNVNYSEEMRVLGNSFGENKGRLPWPVDKGLITSHFGLQKHPVLKYVTEDNIGIEITSNGKTEAKAVFKGEVVSIFAISGANMAVILRHGKYLTVYQNLVNVKVKPGDTVNTGQTIADVFSDSSDGGKAVLKFMVYEEKNKLNPELWIAKK